MSELEYSEMLIRQGGCAICGTTASTRALAVDHCHSSGVVRGILCGRCNMALGLLGDTAEGVQKALDYLRVAEA